VDNLVEPGVSLRAAYIAEIGRALLGGGIDLTAVFVPHDLTVGGFGPVGRTTAIAIQPYLSAGVRL
jgi:hypothetical protein